MKQLILNNLSDYVIERMSYGKIDLHLKIINEYLEKSKDKKFEDFRSKLLQKQFYGMLNFKKIEQILSFNENRKICIIYNPFDGATEKEIEDFAHYFLEHLSKLYDEDDYFTTIQSFIAPATYTINNKTVEKGKWVLDLEIHCEDLWKEIQALMEESK